MPTAISDDDDDSHESPPVLGEEEDDAVDHEEQQEEDASNDEEDEGENNDDELLDDEEAEEVPVKSNKRKRFKKSEFIDDEAELSGDDEVSEDEAERSDDDQLDPELVDQEAKELDSDEEEEVRGLYHKQLETEDKRALLLLQEQFEDKDVAIGQRRRKKFRWQTKELMENSLRRHYDPDDDDDDDDSDDSDGEEFNFDPNRRLRRPTAEALLLGSTRMLAKNANKPLDIVPLAETSTSNLINEDSNSRTMPGPSRQTAQVSTDINRFLFRDKELVEALSTRETVIVSREERDRNIQKELRRVLTSKSVFDQLYG